MSEIVCNRCGSTDYRTEQRGPHIGAYCNNCNKFIKWLPKNGCKKPTGNTFTSVNNSNNGSVGCTGNSCNIDNTNKIPEPVRGTEKMQLQYTSTGTLILRMDGKQFMLYNAESMTERPRIVLKHGMDKMELLLGDTLDVYVM